MTGKGSSDLEMGRELTAAESIPIVHVHVSLLELEVGDLDE